MSTIIEMPKLSDTMTVGTVVKWHKQVGDEVSNGDILAEVETDKATMELENFDDGVLLQLLAKEGDEVEIGKPLAVVGEQGEQLPVFEDSPTEPSIAKTETDKLNKPELSAEKTPEEEKTTPSLSTDFNATKEPTGRILASPLAKKIAKEKNIDLLKIKGSGPHGRITKKDLGGDFPSVLPSSQETSTSLSPNLLQSKKIPISKMRSVIAKRLLESKTTIPHFYLQKEINSEPLGLARQSINRRLESVANETATEKVSINDLILLACASAIPLVPEINTSWGENEIIFHGDVHLAFGVAVDDGLVTPVIRKADSLNLKNISREAKSLIHKSRNKKLTPDEMSGSTFTVTNLGMFGIDFFSGIINPPNAAILSVGASVPKAVVGKDGSIRSGETMKLGLSCDHRLVDGAVGARFLQTLAGLLENPASLLV
ncbi:dihydrolipoamide acetyltransferase family protein [Candidatus Chordibacter forsetii]|uniref:dihydrolipoamide acetyltransferase family protein n=1 Tax=Candidatus Chordibacter forsetii TaxID=3381758 RepID=UPI003899AE04